MMVKDRNIWLIRAKLIRHVKKQREYFLYVTGLCSPGYYFEFASHLCLALVLPIRGVSWLSFQHTHILETVQKSFIPMKLSLLPRNFHHLSLHQYSAMSAYLMSMKLYETPIETGLSIFLFLMLWMFCFILLA
jgi:hypothetical protein